MNCIRSLSSDFVTASELAVIASEARQSMKAECVDCHGATLLAMTAIRFRHCERSAAIHASYF
jgi:hypothetical protein